MEFFAWKWLKLFYGEDYRRAQLAHLADCVTFIPYGSMVDHFQHIVYDEPELTPAQRNERWAQLEKIYRPHVDFDGLPFYGEGRGWQRQIHIYEYPFYYIDYCLAQTVALKFWALSQKDYADAWRRYMAFVREGGKKTFTGLCETAGIKDPFAPGSLVQAAEAAGEFLG
jgi:oligoendopeptidase F